MSRISAAPPRDNADQVEFWNGTAGKQWSQLQKQVDANLRPFADAAIAALAPQPGERVIDVGCGAGDTTLSIADRVQGHGFVLGVDISRPLLQRAMARAANTPEYPIRFIEADAQHHAFEAGQYDALFSRFGVMFFSDPAAAFANMRRALKPGGRVTFCCWRDRRENEWVRLPVEATRKHLSELPPGPGPDEPGPFSFADSARAQRVLNTAGYVDIAETKFDTELNYGDDPAEAAHFLTQIGPVSRVLLDQPETLRATVAATLEKTLAARSGPGGIRLGAATWIVTARNP